MEYRVYCYQRGVGVTLDLRSFEYFRDALEYSKERPRGKLWFCDRWKDGARVGELSQKEQAQWTGQAKKLHKLEKGAA